MSGKPTRVTTTINFDQEGKQCDFLRLPHSVHRSAYGWLPMPLVCIKNGVGPTVLLMSGNHGDEYEGQVTLSRLIREIEPDDIQGRLIILPMANYPAAHAGLRTSPIDDLNLNRVFPGDPDGTATMMIAHYIESVLMGMADYMMDLHSGGSSLMYMPSTIVPRGEGGPDFARRLELARVFGAPTAFVMPGTHAAGNSSGAAIRQGIISLGTEVGGGGTVTPECLEICEQGVRRVLGHLDVLISGIPAPADTPPRVLRAPNFSYFAYASEDGLFEPLVELGDEVEAGQLAALIHYPETPWQDPAEVRFEAAGQVVCKRIPGRTERGDCLFHLGRDVEQDDLE